MARVRNGNLFCGKCSHFLICEIIIKVRGIKLARTTKLTQIKLTCGLWNTTELLERVFLYGLHNVEMFLKIRPPTVGLKPPSRRKT